MQKQTVIFNGTVLGSATVVTSAAVPIQYAREVWFTFTNTGPTNALGATQVAFEQCVTGDGTTFVTADQTNVCNFINYTGANSLAAGATAIIGVVPKVAGALSFGNATHFRCKVTGNAGVGASTTLTVTVNALFDLGAPVSPFAGL